MTHPGRRRVSVLVDNDSWILPYAEELVARARAAGNDAVLVRAASAVPEGDVAFLIGCTRIVPPEILARSAINLVVHESDLPRGKGFAPMTWQILEGASVIPVCLFHATVEVDAGAIVYRDEILLDGTEVCSELRDLQGRKTVEICLRFLAERIPPKGILQSGPESHYPRRTPADSRVDPHRTLADQFDLLRVCDPLRYPAFMEYRGRRYTLALTPTDGAPETDDT